ncbi:hypothetical protein MEBOL_001817 [Melittangium boletus DSM 14713]|uniref:Uncharacterized protein n=1 Tax=Melittangium boletus DSM 14713 TaxID=1294270 RepID=A0A250IB45_9BACT|nr:hypothetical protein MEBOL_001817 [Melittangium boletus DSM 14713]
MIPCLVGAARSRRHTMDNVELLARRFDDEGARRRRRQRVWGLLVLAVASGGCTLWRPTPERQVVWPDDTTASLVGAPMEAGAVIAAGAAVREMVAHNESERLFRGCSSPQQGLDVAVFKQAGSDLYYVVLHQRFDRCGGPRSRVLDWWYEYAVTEQGEVVAEAPPEAAEASPPTVPEVAPSEPMPAPEAAPPPAVDDSTPLAPPPGVVPGPPMPEPSSPTP